MQDEEFLLLSGNELPAEQILSAEQKLAGYHEFKSDVDGRLQRVYDEIAYIRQMLRDYAYDGKTQTGYLTQS